jgi:peptide/nickel transport system permease protein
MVKLFVRRLAVGLLIVWLASVLVFLATILLPGDAAQVLLGRESSPAALALLRTQMHLNDPAIVQYGRWLGNLVTGHWGQSLVSPDSVAQIVRTGVENTGLVMVLTTAITTPVALVFGSIGALRSKGLVDHGLTVLTLVLVALPPFVIAVALIFLLATSVFHILPAASLVNPSQSILSQLDLVVLPTATLVLGIVSYPLRMVRASMAEVLESDYVLLARLHGLSLRRVLVRHALPNAVATTIQATALNLIYLVGGVVVVETVFSYPGVGYSLVQAVNDRDIPVIQTLVVLLAAFYVLVNLVADMLVIAVTPRLRSGGRPPSVAMRVPLEAEALP